MAASVNPTDLDNRLRVAEAVIREADRVAAEHFARRGLLKIDRKGAQDLVSEADRACEDLIVAGLARLFPSDGFIGEERGSRGVDAAAVWVVDPIDGTHNFLTGVPFWCVSVGLVAAGELVLGIIYHPLAAELYSARKGGGAFLNGQPIKVSGESDSLARGSASVLATAGQSQSIRKPSVQSLEPVANICGSDPARSASPTRPQDASTPTGSVT